MPKSPPRHDVQTGDLTVGGRLANFISLMKFKILLSLVRRHFPCARRGGGRCDVLVARQARAASEGGGTPVAEGTAASAAAAGWICRATGATRAPRPDPPRRVALAEAGRRRRSCRSSGSTPRGPGPPRRRSGRAGRSTPSATRPWRSPGCGPRSRPRPTDAESLRWLAAAAYDLGDQRTVIESLKALTSLKPDDARAWRTLALVTREEPDGGEPEMNAARTPTRRPYPLESGPTPRSAENWRTCS